MRTYVRTTNAILVPLMVLGGGCASVGTAATPKKASSPSSTTAPAAAQAHIVQAAWPGEAVRLAKGGLVMLDAFEGLLLRAGLNTLDQLPPRDRPLDREGATRLLAVLLDKPLPLSNFPQRMGACFLLREVLENEPASRDELNRRVNRFRQVVVLRPDGYLAWVLSGRTQQRAGPGQVELKDGLFKANGFVLGQFYSGRRGAYFPVDAQMEPLRDSTILGEVYDDGDLFGRAMDGAGEAFFALAMAVGKFLSRPLDGIAGLRNLPAGVAALIASSPEYLERFELMTAGEQIQAVSRLTTTLLTMFAGGGAISAGLTRGLGGMEVTGLSLSAQGTLALGRVVVPAGGVATVLAAGAGAPIVLQSTAAPSQSAAVDGMKSGSADPADAAGGAARTAPTIARMTPALLPAAEQASLLRTLGHIEAGTTPTGSLATRWGAQFKNWAGDLPGARGAASPYLEYRVAPPPGMNGAGPLRVVVNQQTGELYYTWTHYGDTGVPAFVRIR